MFLTSDSALPSGKRHMELNYQVEYEGGKGLSAPSLTACCPFLNGSPSATGLMCCGDGAFKNTLGPDWGKKNAGVH